MQYPYQRDPVAIVDGIPIFTKHDEYIETYEQIAHDHLAAQAEGINNPFMVDQQVESAERATRDVLQRFASPESVVLDAGVGLGGLLAPLDELKRYGVDVSMKYLVEARKKGIEVAMATLEELPYESACFDVVLSCDVLEHVLRLDRVTEQLIRVLKPGGHLIVRVPNEESLQSYVNGTQPYQYAHIRRFDIDGLRLHFETAFSLEYVEHVFDGYLFNSAAQMKIRTPSKQARIRDLLTELDTDNEALEPLRRAIAVTEEELVDALITLRDGHPEVFSALAQELVSPVEVIAVFRKPGA